MQRVGGIIALVAGISGGLAAGFTLLIGEANPAFGDEAASIVIASGWSGLLFSFLTMILGVVALGTRSKAPGMLLMVCALLGALLSGTFVALFMILAFIGGLLATIGTKRRLQAAPSTLYLSENTMHSRFLDR